MARRDDGKCWTIIKDFPEHETDGQGNVRTHRRKRMLKRQTVQHLDPNKDYQFYHIRRDGYMHRLRVSEVLVQ